MIANHEERRTNNVSTRNLLAQGFVKLCGTPANLAVKYGFIALIVNFAATPFSESVVALSGKHTEANINFSANADVNVSQRDDVKSDRPDCSTNGYLLIAILGGLVGIGGFYQAHRQKKLRQDVIQEKYDRIAALEKVIDSNRTSCGLTQRGDTNPEHL